MNDRNKKTHVERNVKVGTQEITDAKTGEIKTINVMEIRQTDFNWNKVWLGHLLDALDVIGNKKIAVMNYLLEIRDIKTNQVFVTQRMVCSKLGTSLQTVSSTFKALQSAKVLKKERNGVYILNPEIIWKGDTEGRMDILLTYKKITQVEQKKGKITHKK